MKPAPFDYLRPRDLGTAVRALAEDGGDGRVISGGQSLGPMLNFRLAAPGRLVDVSALPELRAVESDGDRLVLGAAVTHAEIEDGAGGPATAALLPRVGAGIAYRPVRNRGTVGGSLAHADPGGDWVPVMMALGATVRIAGGGGSREIPVAELIAGPLSTTLADGEIIVAVVVPRLGAVARWGHRKFCRKPGDFADSIAVGVIDRDRGASRIVLASRSESPVRLAATEGSLGGNDALSPAIERAVDADLDALATRSAWPAHVRALHRTMVMRMLTEALA